MNEGNQLLALISRLKGAFIGRDEGIFMPFNTYVAMPSSISSSIAIASAVRKFSYIQWTQSVFVATANDASNYWIIYLSDNVTTLAQFNTSAYVSNAWYTVDLTSLTQPATPPNGGFVTVGAIKIGSPGNLYWACPAVRVM